MKAVPVIFNYSLNKIINKEQIFVFLKMEKLQDYVKYRTTLFY